MKKVLTALCLALACSSVMAQEAAPAPAAAKAPAASADKAPWPVWLAFNSAEDIDVVGLRMTLPYGKCESVTGFDLGIYGTSRYFEGLQVNILRNEAKDILSGFQGGCLTDRTVIRHVYGLYDYNSANLIYCEDAEFLDFGHNEILKQCDFVAGMPKLRAVMRLSLARAESVWCTLSTIHWG